MGSFTVRHRFPIAADAFWERIFFDEAFNKDFYLGELGFARYEMLEDETAADGSRKRVIETQPQADAPAAVRKIMGDGLIYLEKGHFDASTRRYRFQIETPKFGDKVQVSGEFWVEAAGEAACDRVCSMDVKVKMFGVGGLVESFIERQTKDSYERAASFTVSYLGRAA